MTRKTDTDQLSSLHLHKHSYSRLLNIIYFYQKNKNTSVLLLTSRQTLLQDVWLSFLNVITKMNLPYIFCIDEVHQFVQFGISFQSKFQLLKNTNINVIQSSDGYFKVQITFMAATSEAKLFSQIQGIFGPNMKYKNTFWGDTSTFCKAHIY